MTSKKQTLEDLMEGNLKSTFHEKVAYGIANQEWLDRSFDIALRVLDALDDLGWSKSKLAIQLEVSRQRVSKMLKGQENFTLDTLVKFERVLGIQLVTVLQPDEVVTKKKVKDFYDKNVYSSRVTVDTFAKYVSRSTHKSERTYLRIAS